MIMDSQGCVHDVRPDPAPLDAIKLLTRDEPLLKAHPDKTISPSDFCQLKIESQPLPFIDLKAQQDAIRPQLEQNIHRVLHHGRYILGPEVGQLEERLAAYTGPSTALLCCTELSQGA